MSDILAEQARLWMVATNAACGQWLVPDPQPMKGSGSVIEEWNTP